MKKITLVLAAMLLSLTSATATKTTSNLDHKDLRITNRYPLAQPIKFVERGVEFLIFTNGEFDFNTNNRYGHSDNYYGRKRNSRRGAINSTYGTPGVSINYSRTRGVHVSYDRFGRIRNIGNVFVNYDAYGRVKRIGSVYMRYRHGKLKQVGGLRIQYNRWGNMVSINGSVNYSNQDCGFCSMASCNVNHFDSDYTNDLYDDGRWNDNYDNYYYYKKGNKTKKKKRRKY